MDSELSASEDTEISELKPQHSIQSQSTSQTEDNYEHVHKNKYKHEIKITWSQIMGGSIGTVLEWYDFAVFGYLASEIGDQFFPHESSHTLRLIYSYAVFGGAFVARPFGGVFFGIMGDKLGRKLALQTSTMLMFIATFLMGCLPTFNHGRYSAGIVSAILLCALRLLQGFSAGGQLVGSMLFLVESSPKERRGFYGSVVQCTACAGTMFGCWIVTAFQCALGPQLMLDYGWRMPFLLSLFIGVLGFVLQQRMPNSAAFQQVMDNQQIVENPFLIAIQNFWKHILIITFAVTPWCIGFYILVVWLPTYLRFELEPVLEEANIINAFMMLWLAACVLLGGYLADAFHYLKVMMVSCILVCVFAIPLFMEVDDFRGSVFPMVIIQFVFAIILGLFGGPLEVFLVEFIDDISVRYCSLGIAYNVSNALFAGTAPIIATAIAQISFVGVAAYLIAMNVLSLGLLYLIHKRRKDAREEN